MTIVVLASCWLLSSFFVIKLLQKYRNPHTTHITILTAVFFCWLIPLSITFLLPIDVSSAKYEKCLLEGEPNCIKSLLYVGPKVRHISWLGVYWSTFVLSWIVVPFLQGYVIAGKFDTLGKSWYSLRINLMFYGACLAVLGVMAFYLKFLTNIRTWTGITGFLMALSNAIGLLAVVVFMGHGLVRIPRYLWHSGDPKHTLKKLEGKALYLKERLSGAEEDLATLTREIQSLPFKLRHKPELHEYVNILLNEAPLPSDDELLASRNRSEDDNINPVRNILDLRYLEHLNYRIREVVSKRDRTAWEWRTLLEKSWKCQDIISNSQNFGFDQLWTSTISTSNKSRTRRRLLWLWNVKIHPFILMLLSSACVVLSFIVFWSEVTLVFDNAELSLVGRLVRWAGPRVTVAEAITAGLLVYLAICTYTSFLKLKVFSYFSLVPGHQTDEKSLLFFSAYFTRFTLPLGYNYLTLIEGTSQERKLVTEFAKVMGTMDLVPLLGRYFNLYVPLGLTLICSLVAFKLHRSFIASICGAGTGANFDEILIDNDDAADGRELINQARRLEERLCRNRSRSNLEFPSRSRNNSYQ